MYINVMLQSKKSSYSSWFIYQDGSDFTKHLPAGELRQAFAPVPGSGATKIMVKVNGSPQKLNL